MSRSHPNNVIQKRQRRARLLHSIYTWHRWMGLSILLWVLMWAVSGLLIEASPALGLDKKKLSANWLLTHYGVSAPRHIGDWGNDNLQEWNQGISYKGQWLEKSQAPIMAALATSNMIVVADPQTIQLYDLNGHWIDQLSTPASMPSHTIQQLGLANNHVVAKTPSGAYEIDGEWLQWVASEQNNINWINRNQAVANQNIQSPKALHDITVERLVLDIHSGTLFGPVGRWLSRLAAVVMILLALSGFYTWFTRFARQH